MSDGNLIARTLYYNREDMAERGRRGAAAQHAKYDTRETTAPMRRAFREKLVHLVDPNDELDPHERERLIREALREHLRAAGRRSGAVRAERAAQT